MTTVVGLMIAGVVAALIYDYTNGLQDAANMLSTIVASRVTTPVQAAILVSSFTFMSSTTMVWFSSCKRQDTTRSALHPLDVLILFAAINPIDVVVDHV